MVHDDFAFVRAVIGLGAAHRLALFGVNDEFESANAVNVAGFVKCIPMTLDHHGQLTADSGVDIIANAEVLIEFSCVNAGVPFADVCAGR